MPNFHEGKIVLLDKTECDLDQYRNGMGELAICLPDGLEYQVVKTRDELTDLEKITSDYSSTFELNIDHRTRILLGNIQYRVVKGVSIFRAILLDGDMVILDGFLRINATVENMLPNTVSYSMQVIGTHQTWKEGMKGLCLQDLPNLGQIVWSESALLDLMQNNGTYVDGGDTVYPMFADFGKFANETQPINNKNVSIYDIRFVVYILPLIKEMFAGQGYCVNSVFLESAYFRKEAIYALKSDFYDLGTRIDTLVETMPNTALIYVANSFSLTPNDAIPFQNVILNNNLYWNPALVRYVNTSTNFIDGISMSINVDVCASVSMVFAIGLFVFNQFNNVILDFPLPDSNQLAIIGSGCVNYQTTVDLDQLFRDNFLSLGTLNPGWSLQVRMFWLAGIGLPPTDFPTIQQGSQLSFSFSGGKHFYENDNVDIATALSCNANQYDYLIDFKNLYNLRFRTDEGNKIVTIEPQPSRYDAYETFTPNAVVPSKSVKGFETGVQDPNEVWDITDLVDVCQEIKKNFEANSNYDSIKFKFKDTTDVHPNYLPYKIEGNELWSKLITLNNVNIPNTLEIALKQIEPTLNDFVQRISFDENRPVFIPIMWDSEPTADGEIEGNAIPDSGTSYENRIFHVFGWVIQRIEGKPGGLLTRPWTFEGVTYIQVPTIAQCLPPGFRIMPSFTPLEVVINNVFGDNVFNFYTKDLVTTFYPEALQQIKEAVELSLEIRLNTQTFRCIDISQMVRIFSERLPLIHLNNHYTISKIIMNFGVFKHATIVLVPKLGCDA